MGGMEVKLKKAVFMMCIPAVITIAVSVYLFVTAGGAPFQGWVTGTVLGILFSFFWVWQVKKGIASNPMVMLKVTFWGFLLKLLVLFLVTFGGYRLIPFDRMYFAGAFVFAVFASVLVEIWFYFSLVKEGKKDDSV